VKNSEQNFLRLHLATLWKRIACLNDAFSEIIELEESPVDSQSLHCSTKIRKGEKGKVKKTNKQTKKLKEQKA